VVGIRGREEEGDDDEGIDEEEDDEERDDNDRFFGKGSRCRRATWRVNVEVLEVAAIPHVEVHRGEANARQWYGTGFGGVRGGMGKSSRVRLERWWNTSCRRKTERLKLLKAEVAIWWSPAFIDLEPQGGRACSDGEVDDDE
jgi:hypothetical protein